MTNKRKVIEHIYPSVIESETVMFCDLGEFLNEQGVTGDQAQDIKLCVSEAFNNAVIHGNRLDATKHVRLLLSANMSDIVADIIDEGENALVNIEQRKEPNSFDEGGRGINLIYERADGVFLSIVADGGLSLRLTFSRIQTKTNLTHDSEASLSTGSASKLQEES